jgi:hypothetical protein
MDQLSLASKAIFSSSSYICAFFVISGLVVQSVFCVYINTQADFNRGMNLKVERKLSDFSAKKQKRTENVKTEMEICGTETKMELFLAKWKQKWIGVFRRNRYENGSFRFWLMQNFYFIIVLYGQSRRHNM